MKNQFDHHLEEFSKGKRLSLTEWKAEQDKIEAMKKKYLEVVQDETKKVIKRLDVTNQSERGIERIERGMSINLNHNEYSLNINESETELPVGDF